MSATAAASTSGHLIAARKISFPREPPPIKPNRIRSFAPRIRPGASTAVAAIAIPVDPPIIDPKNTRRLDMAGLLSINLDRAGPASNDFIIRQGHTTLSRFQQNGAAPSSKRSSNGHHASTLPPSMLGGDQAEDPLSQEITRRRSIDRSQLSLNST